MCSLAGDNVGEPLLKSLCLGHLPNGVKTILVALDENFDQLANVANKINDLTFPQGINSVAARSNHNTAYLQQQIAQLTQQVNELLSFMKRSCSLARNSKHVRIRSNSRNCFKSKLEWQPSLGHNAYRLNNRVLLPDFISKITFLIDTEDISVISKSFVPYAEA
ncbi:transposon Ty3-I Gag-Pol polyprotein [Nephila pilipes]|uniref:Transposon Ty3-I Gag-Pol polyprotein n=1 Tax=Nephila pilipes TaxID=299642 RepID=A0A8X6QGB8_NEPPI|nr:transposon Ty3-I Gag-Pol polyprotein [Nephila pilipes]